ncbi:MAG: L-histidine N(alpha)-methyltransferase [Alphaproteobacteria bacterium]|nr:L-histidine N(alpha)-methyltransferase [Alphaproteobacteria bacterium]
MVALGRRGGELSPTPIGISSHLTAGTLFADFGPARFDDKRGSPLWCDSCHNHVPEMSKSALASFSDLSPAEDDFLGDVVAGLSASRKTLPCKFFYDEVGSQIFDQICLLPEYYPTRTETTLMRAKAAEMSAAIGAKAQVLEYGCGSIEKVRVLLDALVDPASYIAVDISREHLRMAAETLAQDYPSIEVHAICTDFSQPFDVPPSQPGQRRVAFFPGSTIGNFEPLAAKELMLRIVAHVGPGGGLLIGVDRKKDEAILHAAYNDAAGVTAAFNLNLLTRINVELGGNFDVDGFRHEALYNTVDGRIEMHLLSLRDQTVKIGGRRFSFAEGETIHTENSHKYEIDEFQALVVQAGFVPKAVWSDADNLFSVHYVEVPST